MKRFFVFCCFDTLSAIFSPLPGCKKLNEFDLFKCLSPFIPLLQINGREFPAEAFYQRHVRHPNVIELLDVFTQEDNFVFVLERPEKCSDLFDYVEERDHLDEDEGRQFFSNILDAAIHCEGYGVLHQDIKPENIIIDLSKMEAKLTDFGLADDIKDTPIKHFVGKGCTREENTFLVPLSGNTFYRTRDLYDGFWIVFQLIIDPKPKQL